MPSPAEWSEFLSASNSKVERDLAQLTLSDPEQRELYEAARLVQTAFHKCKVQARSQVQPTVRVCASEKWCLHVGLLELCCCVVVQMCMCRVVAGWVGGSG